MSRLDLDRPPNHPSLLAHSKLGEIRRVFANIDDDARHMVTVVGEPTGNDPLEVSPCLYTIFSNIFHPLLIPCRDYSWFAAVTPKAFRNTYP